jgi:hypothetical protein
MAAINAILIPILPEVGSIKVVWYNIIKKVGEIQKIKTSDWTNNIKKLQSCDYKLTFPGAIKFFFSASSTIANAGL